MSKASEIKKGDICPICEMELKKPNYWVRYHVSYEPNLVILACRYCNYTEWALRNKVVVRLRCATPNRIYRVLNLHRKFDILKT